MEGEFEYISWKFRFEHYGQQLTTNCRVSFIDLYLIFSTNFKIVYLPPPTHTHSSKNLQKGKHHSAANKGDRREQKDGRRTHSKNNNNSNNLVPIKITKKDEKSYQRLYQCTHWHPIDAEKRSAYYMCMVELVLFIFSVLDMCVLSSQLVPTILKIS